MKKLILIILAMVFLATPAFASFFLVCDPQAGVTIYQLSGPTWVPTTTPAQADGSIKLDVATANVGTNSLTVKACITDPTWGVLCSEAVPFDFTRPTSPAKPIGIGLVK